VEGGDIDEQPFLDEKPTAGAEALPPPLPPVTGIISGTIRADGTVADVQTTDIGSPDAMNGFINVNNNQLVLSPSSGNGYFHAYNPAAAPFNPMYNPQLGIVGQMTPMGGMSNTLQMANTPMGTMNLTPFGGSHDGFAPHFDPADGNQQQMMLQQTPLAAGDGTKPPLPPTLPQQGAAAGGYDAAGNFVPAVQGGYFMHGQDVDTPMDGGMMDGGLGSPFGFAVQGMMDGGPPARGPSHSGDESGLHGRDAARTHGGENVLHHGYGRGGRDSLSGARVQRTSRFDDVPTGRPAGTSRFDDDATIPRGGSFPRSSDNGGFGGGGFGKTSGKGKGNGKKGGKGGINGKNSISAWGKAGGGKDYNNQPAGADDNTSIKADDPQTSDPTPKQSILGSRLHHPGNPLHRNASNESGGNRGADSKTGGSSSENQINPCPLWHKDVDYEVTTVMLKNIPNKYSRSMLIEQLDRHYRGEYDFLYLPIDFKNQCNVGYAFLNFRSAEVVATRFYPMFHGVDVKTALPGFNSKKVCEVSAGRVQGYTDNVKRLKNSPVMGQLQAHPEWLPLLFDSDGAAKPFPAPDKVLGPITTKTGGKRGQFHGDAGSLAARADGWYGKGGYGGPPHNAMHGMNGNANMNGNGRAYDVNGMPSTSGGGSHYGRGYDPADTADNNAYYKFNASAAPLHTGQYEEMVHLDPRVSMDPMMQGDAGSMGDANNMLC
jgi:hypothetical protein